jgi:DNA-binding GntR family transcriptional regulator
MEAVVALILMHDHRRDGERVECRVACGSHEALLTAMQTRDAEAARAAMRADLSALSKIDGYREGIDEPS